MRAMRFDYSRHPEYKRLKSEKAIAYEPDWETRRAFSTSAGPRSEHTLPQKQPKAAPGQKEPPEPALQIDQLRCVDESDIF